MTDNLENVKNRIVLEAMELEEKLKAISNALYAPHRYKISNEQYRLMSVQRDIMRSYLGVLGLRKDGLTKKIEESKREL